MLDFFAVNTKSPEMAILASKDLTTAKKSDLTCPVLASLRLIDLFIIMVY